ncbi:hypothetical protein [Tahibacter amnicola]|uniref:Uncharacterized protein n=1 Tax=Tahibacter amnicola TaxID=2976241 RepID=A0ABY6BAI3_9GAMM|nr:hypothetical protein [Tahibacter amnicola]UXI67069.1 hypothetical protein N4264_20290 [Tahibacter amnicola]
MALFDSLLNYKTRGRIRSFDMHAKKKATIYLVNSRSFVVFMSDDYIIGEAEIHEAAADPKADVVVYNTWDTMGEGARKEAKRLGIDVCTFGGFGRRLDEINAAT